MASRDEHLMRFVRRVHRRLVLVRAAERGGACVAVASIFACLFATVALLQGRDATPIVLPTLAIGAILGIIWGLARRPTRLDAVLEADRQLQLADLLATAYAQREHDDPWQRAVVAIADDRCRSLEPDAVVIHRYGGRAWGGIGLATALGLTLALLSGVPQDSRARPAEAKRATAATDEMAQSLQSDEIASLSASSSRTRNATASPADSGTGLGAAATAADDAGGRASDDAFARAGDDAGSDGERGGQTSAASGDAVPRPPAAGIEPTAGASVAGGGGAAGDASQRPRSADDASGTSSSGSAAQTKAPPWSSSTWDADRAAAGEAVRSGRVPDAYRDVVGEYFDASREAPAASSTD